MYALLFARLPSRTTGPGELAVSPSQNPSFVFIFHFSKTTKQLFILTVVPTTTRKKWSIYGFNLLSIYIFSQNQKHMRHLFNIYSFRCLRALELVEHEYCYLKNKLHELFQVNNKNPKPKTPNSCFISQILVGWSLLSADIIWWLCS